MTYRSLSLREGGFPLFNYIRTLQEAINRGILSLSEVDEMLMMTRKRLIEETHPYAINCRKNGRFITTIREDGKLKQISASSEKDIVDKLYAFTLRIRKISP